MSSRYPEPRAGRYHPAGEQRAYVGDLVPPSSARGYPAPCAPAGQAADARGEYESAGWYEEFTAVAAAGTAFIEAFRFSGVPDSIHFSTTGGVLDVRLKPRGGSPGTVYNITDQQKHEMHATGEVVEFRDPGGAGGTTLYGTARFARRPHSVRAPRELDADQAK